MSSLSSFPVTELTERFLDVLGLGDPRHYHTRPLERRAELKVLYNQPKRS